MDAIELKQIACRCRVGVSEALRKKAQDIFIDLVLETELAEAGRTDDFRKAVDYWGMENVVREAAESRPWQLVESIAERAAQVALAHYPQVALARVIATKRPKALKNRKYVTVELARAQGGKAVGGDFVWVRGIACKARIGVPEEERRRPQKLVFDVGLSMPLAECAGKDDFRLAIDTESVANIVQEEAESREWRLLEAAAERVAAVVLGQQKRARRVVVRAVKRPAVMPRTGNVVVVVERGAR